MCEDHDVVGEASGRAQELVDGAGGGEFVESAESGDDGLLDEISFPAIFGDLEVLMTAGLFDAHEHEGSPGLTPHTVRHVSR